MKNIRFLTFVLTIATLVLSACGAAAATATPAPIATKVEAMPVTFVGIVDSIAGDQWVISGTTMTVAESVVHDGPFNVGDRIKVEGLVHPDGSFTVLRVEAPASQNIATQTPVVVDNTNEAIGNANINDDNVNDGNVNDSNINDDSSNVNTNDDNSNDSNSNDSNTNDDNGSNTNDDNGGNSNDDNSNDDNGGNSNDDNGNDDNSGKDGDDDNGGNDNDD